MTLPTATEVRPTVCVIKLSATGEKFPKSGPVNLKAYTPLAFSRFKSELELYADGFLTIPILATWFP